MRPTSDFDLFDQYRYYSSRFLVDSTSRRHIAALDTIATALPTFKASSFNFGLLFKFDVALHERSRSSRSSGRFSVAGLMTCTPGNARRYRRGIRCLGLYSSRLDYRRQASPPPPLSAWRAWLVCGIRWWNGVPHVSFKRARASVVPDVNGSSVLLNPCPCTCVR